MIEKLTSFRLALTSWAKNGVMLNIALVLGGLVFAATAHRMFGVENMIRLTVLFALIWALFYVIRRYTK